MFFRLDLTVRGISLHPDGADPLMLTLRGIQEHGLRITLSNDDATEGSNLRCVVATEFAPSGNVVAVFRRLEDSRLPEGHLPRERWGRDHEYIDPEGNIRNNYIVPLYLMPEGFQMFARALAAELHDAADAAVGLLRWRSRTLGPRQPLSSRGLSWAFESEHSHPMPSDTSVEALDSARIEISENTATELQRLIGDREREPLGHALFREAWSSRRENPSSALLMGMAALEIGMKQYIAACVPAAAWLAENAPAPPVNRILREYVATLDPPGGGDPPTFNDDLLRLLKNAVNERNSLAHTGRELAHDRVKEVLLAVRDVLWALDSARGHEWAADWIRSSLEEQPAAGFRRI